MTLSIVRSPLSFLVSCETCHRSEPVVLLPIERPQTAGSIYHRTRRGVILAAALVRCPVTRDRRRHRPVRLSCGVCQSAWQWVPGHSGARERLFGQAYKHLRDHELEIRGPQA